MNTENQYAFDDPKFADPSAERSNPDAGEKINTSDLTKRTVNPEPAYEPRIVTTAFSHATAKETNAGEKIKMGTLFPEIRCNPDPE